MFGTLKTLRKCPVTLLIAVLSLLGFVLFQPSDIAGFGIGLLPVKIIAGSFLHLNLQHLGVNLAFWLIAGWHLEPKIGSKRLALIAVLAVLAGGLLETWLVDGKFIGLSAACYGLLGALIWEHVSGDKTPNPIRRGLIFLLVFAVLDIIFNLFISTQNVASGAHIGGLMAGFLSSLGLGKSGSHSPNRVFREMEDRDVAAVLEIIYDHDEDDGEDAEAAFAETLADKYVMEFEGRMMGMTGFRQDPFSAESAWLSFTYVHDYFRKKGNAYWMMHQLRNVLEASGIKRLYIATSDYVDEDTGEDIYLAARSFYENKLNARRELRLESFYSPNESKYIYSLPVSGDGSQIKTVPIPTGHTARFIGLEEIPESETSYTVIWEELTPEEPDPKSTRPTMSFTELFHEVQSYGGKMLFVTLPSYISDTEKSELRAVGFRELGELPDYFGGGVSEVHWGRKFD